ncbi:MAG: hypothetical protein V1735_03610 [Nanoarchaeota archaeon]
MSKRFLSLALLALVLLVISPAVLGLGVSPGRKTIEFVPDGKEAVAITVSNNEHKDMKLVISARGELAQYVTLSAVLLDFTKEETSKTFSYKVAMPHNFTSPGIHNGEIVIQEVPQEKGEEGTFMGATLSVVTELRVRVPYPGKYAEAGLEISGARVNEPTGFIVPVMNYGEQDIMSAKASIDIMGPTNDPITSLQTDSRPVKAKETKELTASWLANVHSGSYLAKVTLNYDGLETRIEKLFSIGDLSIELVDVQVKDFKLGQIARFDVTIENKWNQELDQVYVELVITDDKGDTINAVKSSTEILPPIGRKSLTLFWDTTNVPQGTYNGKIIIHFRDRTFEKQSKLVVTLDQITTRFTELTGQAVLPGEKKGFSTTLLLIIIVGLLILINIGWFVYIRKARGPPHA